MIDYPLVILGAGATGLGAAYRLTERRNEDFVVFEQHDYAGGHAASFTTPEGFTFDEGGHVLFSHYPYFDAAVSEVLRGKLLKHRRESWIWLAGHWVRYPFQEHIFQLPPALAYECVAGLIDASMNGRSTPTNFREWIEASFGQGVADRFMIPYNEKVWAHPTELMDYRWIGERVATVDLKSVIRRILSREESQWGPNSDFLYPLEGGFGGLLRAVQANVNSDRVRLGHTVRRIDPEQRVVHLRGGERIRYDSLISSLPLPVLIRLVDGPTGDLLLPWGKHLLHNGVFAVGIGLRGEAPSDKHWVYFPEQRYPFYRLTFLSNYSPTLVPGPGFYSLLVETSFSAYRPLDRRSIVRNVLGALEALGVMKSQDIVSIWSKGMRFGYPVPSLGRDIALRQIHDLLERHGIYSRGRFGGWRYEIGNTDHSFMQGVEVVDRVLSQHREVTFA